MSRENPWLFEVPFQANPETLPENEWEMAGDNEYNFPMTEDEWEALPANRMKQASKRNSKQMTPRQRRRSSQQTRPTALYQRPIKTPTQQSSARQFATSALLNSGGFRSALFQGDPDLLSVLQGKLRLGRPLDPQYPAPIKSQGSSIAKIQTALVKLDYPLPTHGIDGRYGDETYNVVLNYKRRHNIRTDTGYLDGIVGSKTIRHLDNALAQKDVRKTNVLVNVRDNLGRPISSPLVVVRLRDLKTYKLLGEQRALSPTLTFALNSAQQSFLIETHGDRRFWPWKGISKPTGYRHSFALQPTANSNTQVQAQAIVPRLRDITESKDDLVGWVQTGDKPPKVEEVSCGYPPNTVPCPRLPILNTNQLPVINTVPNACGANLILTKQCPYPENLDGNLRILCATPETAKSDPPGLFLIWIPNKLKFSEIDFHVFFHANVTSITPEMKIKYPLGKNEKSEQPYVNIGYQHLLWRSYGAYQHHLAKRSCVYVVPVSSLENNGFSGLTATKLLGWLQEIVAIIVQNHSPGPYLTYPPVGKVALSCFSAGCETVANLLKNVDGNQIGRDFLDQNVGELYFFDTPDKLTSNKVVPAVRAWQQRQGPRRIVRAYTGFFQAYEEFANLIRTSSAYSFPKSSIAKEMHSEKGSSVLLGSTLFSLNCDISSCLIPIWGTDLHGWYMRFFMAHALAASWFDPI